MKYTVRVYEKHYRDFEVDANSLEQAVEIALSEDNDEKGLPLVFIEVTDVLAIDKNENELWSVQ